MVSPLPCRGGTSEWFVVGEDWWTAIATPFLCEINSTCRSVLYEWWRPPQVIHTAAQRHSSGPHRTYKAGIKQSLFPTGPCITDPRPPHKHTHMNTQMKGNSARSYSRPFKFISKGFSAVSSKSLPQHNCQFTLWHRTSILDRPRTGCTPEGAMRWDWGMARSAHLRAE